MEEFQKYFFYTIFHPSILDQNFDFWYTFHFGFLIPLLCVKTETQNLGAKVRGKLPDYLTETQNLMAKVRGNLPDYLLDENKKLDLSKLAETFETQSLRSIREKLINVLSNVFAFMKELFRHTKKVFYVVTMCLMITDGYK